MTTIPGEPQNEVSLRSIPDQALAAKEVLEVVRLPDDLRLRAGRFFGEDFGNVSVWIHPQVADLGCRALAGGARLYFAPGTYGPETTKGRRLVFHELAHIVQQRRGWVDAPGQGLVVVDDPASEDEAERMADLAQGCAVGPWAEAAGRPVHVSRAGRILQPVITIGGQRYDRNPDAVWPSVDATNIIPMPLKDDCRSKFRHWVNDSTSRSLPGLKAQN